MTGNLGGAEQVLLILLRELRRLRPDWPLTVLTGDEGPLIDSVRDLGCQAEVLAFPRELNDLGDWGGVSLAKLARAIPSVLRYRSKLRGKLGELSPIVVQTNGFKMHLLSALTCPKKSRLIWHIHDFVSKRRAMKTLLRWCANKPSAVVAISPTVAADFACVSQAQVIWNAVDLPRFAPTPPEPHQELRIGLIATFAKWKGHDVFLQALQLLPKDLAWHATIVGGDIYKRAATQWTESELRTLAKSLNVEFTGFLPNPATLLKTLDIVVHASTEPEPFGLVIAEAMAAGRAVITTSDTIVTDNVNGLICRRNNPADLARALIQLARNPGLRARLAQAAMATAQERFQPERMAQEFITLYETTA